MEKTERIILGIDPGTNIMGYGLLRVRGSKAEMMTMGVIDLHKMSDPYLRLGKIFERVTGIIDEYLPDEMAIEAQGVAIAAAIRHDVPIHEYAPMKIKMAITGQGQASKEQVAAMLQRILRFSKDNLPKFMDATDALGAAYCHFLQLSKPDTGERHYNSWKDYVRSHKERIANQG